MSELKVSSKIKFDVSDVRAKIYADATERSALGVVDIPVKVQTSPSTGYTIGDLLDLDVRSTYKESVVLVQVVKPTTIAPLIAELRPTASPTLRRMFSSFLTALASAESQASENFVANLTASSRSLISNQNWRYNEETNSIDAMGLEELIKVWNEVVGRINNLNLRSEVARSGKFIKYLPVDREDSDTYAYISQEFSTNEQGQVLSRYQIKHSEKNYYGSGDFGASTLNSIVRFFARRGGDNFVKELSSGYFDDFNIADGSVNGFLVAIYLNVAKIVRKAIIERLSQIKEVVSIDLALETVDVLTGDAGTFSADAEALAVA